MSQINIILTWKSMKKMNQIFNFIFVFVVFISALLNETVNGNEWLAIRPHSSEYVHTLPFPNSILKYKFRGDQTNGHFLLFEADYLDQGPEHHIHTREDELFHIIEGNVQFIVDGKQFCGSTGDYVYVPKYVSQGLRIENVHNSTKRVRIQILVTPSGLEGFLDEVAPLYYTDQNNFTRINEISIKYGIINLEPIEWKDLGCFNQQ